MDLAQGVQDKGPALGISQGVVFFYQGVDRIGPETAQRFGRGYLRLEISLVQVVHQVGDDPGPETGDKRDRLVQEGGQLGVVVGIDIEKRGDHFKQGTSLITACPGHFLPDDLQGPVEFFGIGTCEERREGIQVGGHAAPLFW